MTKYPLNCFIIQKITGLIFFIILEFVKKVTTVFARNTKLCLKITSILLFIRDLENLLIPKNMK